MYEPEMLVFVDETGCDRHAALCCYMVTHYKGKENVIGPSVWILEAIEGYYTCTN